eukprot:1380331-Amorphochlora_amoeboformis.AAC.1
MLLFVRFSREKNPFRLRTGAELTTTTEALVQRRPVLEVPGASRMKDLGTNATKQGMMQGWVAESANKVEKGEEK